MLHHYLFLTVYLCCALHARVEIVGAPIFIDLRVGWSWGLVFTADVGHSMAIYSRSDYCIYQRSRYTARGVAKLIFTFPLANDTKLKAIF